MFARLKHPACALVFLTLQIAMNISVAVRAHAQTSNTWTQGTAMPTARQGVATGVIKGKIYAIGGATNTAVVNFNEIYNPTTKTWANGAPMPTPPFVPASAVVNNILYVIGGQSGSGVLNVVEAYNPATNTWTTKAPMPTPRDSIYAVVSKGSHLRGRGIFRQPSCHG